MRAFWASTCSFFIAFVGWFALAPVAVDVMYSIGQCENQLYKVADHPTRKAFVTFKDIKTKEPYCVHGIVDDKSDCKEIPTEACPSDPTGQRNTLACCKVHFQEARAEAGRELRWAAGNLLSAQPKVLRLRGVVLRRLRSAPS